MDKYKCEKGKKQYKLCKKYDADYCSDCPHGIKKEDKEDNQMEYTNDEKLFLRIKEKNKQTWLDSDDINFLISFIEKQQIKIQDLENRNSKCSKVPNNVKQRDSNEDIFTKEEIGTLKSLVKMVEEQKKVEQDMLLFKAKIQTLNEIFRG